ncbi:hypothetical protein AB0939_04100 [Streptomyces sp. NPDC006990]|uniref:hypothetical protein n=1 Tax=unclassified Streptomyces TaxID=2593676 RepID=UPI0034518053
MTERLLVSGHAVVTYVVRRAALPAPHRGRLLTILDLVQVNDSRLLPPAVRALNTGRPGNST